MAKRLVMVRPLPFTIASSANMTNSANLLTATPKEAATLANNTLPNVVLDLGASVSIDSFFIGYLSRPLDALSVLADNANPPTTVVQASFAPVATSSLYTPVYHHPVVLAAPVTARYVKLSLDTAAGADTTAGVICVGKSVQPSWGHEYGSGRPIEDTGNVERLFDGGFGKYDGVVAGGYQWTFGDLSDAELTALFALAKDRGQTREILVIEDPDQTDGLNERTHWGIFDRLETYERQVPGASRYSFKVRDWA